MYPLDVHNPALGGYAVANTEAEHKALSEAGYLPAFVASEPVAEPADEKTTLRAALDAKGISYDARWGVAKLREALEA